MKLPETALKVLRRPPDGSCFYWSAGTGIGSFQAFQLESFGLGAPVERSGEQQRSIQLPATASKVLRRPSDGACFIWLAGTNVRSLQDLPAGDVRLVGACWAA